MLKAAAGTSDVATFTLYIRNNVEDPANTAVPLPVDTDRLVNLISVGQVWASDGAGGLTVPARLLATKILEEQIRLEGRAQSVAPQEGVDESGTNTGQLGGNGWNSRVTRGQEDTMKTWMWYHRFGAAVLIPLLVLGGPLAAAPIEKYDPIRQISAQAIDANLLIALDRSGSMALDRKGNGFVRGYGADGTWFTADDTCGSFGDNPAIGGSPDVFYPGIPYGSPMVDTYGLPALRNTADGYAFAGGIVPVPIKGENATGTLRWKAAEPLACEVGSGLFALYYGGSAGDSNWKIPDTNAIPPSPSPIDFRVDPTVSFSAWTTAQLPAGVGTVDANGNPARFSVRWQGWVVVPETGNYQLRFTTADGARVWWNGALLFDAWTGWGAADVPRRTEPWDFSTNSDPDVGPVGLDLERCAKYRIEIHYFADEGLEDPDPPASRPLLAEAG